METLRETPVETPMETLRHSFKAMGTTVELVASPDSDPRAVSRAAAVVEEIFAVEEQRFSRFRTTSELSHVNALAGSGWVPVSETFMTMLRTALEAAHATGGLFDPTILPALKAAGYDRDYEEIVAAAEAEQDDLELASLRRDLRDLMVKDVTTCGVWTDIELRGAEMRMPAGTELDFGGIAKGWTVDKAAEAVADLPWAIVDAGGDLRLTGVTPEGGLDIGVEDPEARGTEALRVRLESGGLATTSVTVRSWGQGMHHVIDPRTSLSAATGVLQATVWGDTCAQAEVWSKAAVLTGTPILERVPASLVLTSGEIVTNFAEADLLEELEPLELEGIPA